MPHKLMESEKQTLEEDFDTWQHNSKKTSNQAQKEEQVSLSSFPFGMNKYGSICSWTNRNIFNDWRSETACFKFRKSGVSAQYHIWSLETAKRALPQQ